MDNGRHGDKVTDAEIVVHPGEGRRTSALARLAGPVVKAGVLAGMLLRSETVRRGLLRVGGVVLREVLNMPGGYGTGTPGGGPGARRGGGAGDGRGRGCGNRPGSGPGGDCVCPGCGKRVPHRRGVPCYSVGCPGCGTPMVKG